MDAVIAVMACVLFAVLCMFAGVANAAPSSLKSLAHKEAVRHGVSPELVYAVIQKESSWRTQVVGDDGRSIGLMQVYFDKHKDRCRLASKAELKAPLTNLRCGISYLAYCRREFPRHFLECYNGGPGWYRYEKGRMMTEKYRAEVESILASTDQKPSGYFRLPRIMPSLR